MHTQASTDQQVPFFRVKLSDTEIESVVDCLRSGWLTSGPRVREFEAQFAKYVGAQHAIALNSGTAALHLAVEALGLERGQAVLVPTMTFAATAEVVRYQGGVPILVDCDPVTLNIDLADAERKLSDVRRGATPFSPSTDVVGIMPVHVGGLMLDMDAVADFASNNSLWIVEDAAHALPAAYPSQAGEGWRRCGQNTAAVTCFSFYANKTITTGEGGMAVTADEGLAERIRRMSLHGLSRDAWQRYSQQGNWDYAIVAPGYKYNLTDVGAALGICQLARAEELWHARREIAGFYRTALEDLPQLELPIDPHDRLHAWHLYPVRLKLENLTIDRNAFINGLRSLGVMTSVHWRPLHLHPYYQHNFGWNAGQLPVASHQWQRLISLPFFPDMQPHERQQVVQAVRQLCQRYATPERSCDLLESTF